MGNITQIAELSQTRDFAYDDLQRLIGGGIAAAPESYAYDPEGNRTVSHLSAGHATDIANRLTEDDGFCYTYDANGNLKTKTAKVASACTGGVTSYSYDAQNKLTRIDFPDLTFAAYRYDGLGRRIEKDVNGALTLYVYDGSDILLEFDGAASLLARYSRGQRVDRPLAVERGGQSYYYQADHQGSLRKITDVVGAVVNSYDYDSYGNIEASVEGIANPFTYTGREFDGESGLHYYRARYYDAATGRFINQDPIGFTAGDANLYRYVFNNPVNLQDPTGQFVPPPVVYIVPPPVVYIIVEGIIYLLILNDIWDGPDTPQPQPDPEGGGNNNNNNNNNNNGSSNACEDPGDNEDDPDGSGDGDGDDGNGDGDEDGDNDCQRLYMQIDTVVRNLKQRSQELKADKLGLPLTGKFSIEGHQKQFRFRQRNLRKLLIKAQTKGCNGFRSDAWYWASKPAPFPLDRN